MGMVGPEGVAVGGLREADVSGLVEVIHSHVIWKSS
jgi:hypothetical protein